MLSGNLCHRHGKCIFIYFTLAILSPSAQKRDTEFSAWKLLSCLNRFFYSQITHQLHSTRFIDFYLFILTESFFLLGRHNVPSEEGLESPQCESLL